MKNVCLAWVKQIGTQIRKTGKDGGVWQRTDPYFCQRGRLKTESNM